MCLGVSNFKNIGRRRPEPSRSPLMRFPAVDAARSLQPAPSPHFMRCVRVSQRHLRSFLIGMSTAERLRRFLTGFLAAASASSLLSTMRRTPNLGCLKNCILSLKSGNFSKNAKAHINTQKIENFSHMSGRDRARHSSEFSHYPLD